MLVLDSPQIPNPITTFSHDEIETHATAPSVPYLDNRTRVCAVVHKIRTPDVPLSQESNLPPDDEIDRQELPFLIPSNVVIRLTCELKRTCLEIIFQRNDVS